MRARTRTLGRVGSPGETPSKVALPFFSLHLSLSLSFSVSLSLCLCLCLSLRFSLVPVLVRCVLACRPASPFSLSVTLGYLASKNSANWSVACTR